MLLPTCSKRRRKQFGPVCLMLVLMCMRVNRSLVLIAGCGEESKTPAEPREACAGCYSFCLARKLQTMSGPLVDGYFSFAQPPLCTKVLADGSNVFLFVYKSSLVSAGSLRAALFRPCCVGVSSLSICRIVRSIWGNQGGAK